MELFRGWVEEAGRDPARDRDRVADQRLERHAGRLARRGGGAQAARRDALLASRRCAAASTWTATSPASRKRAKRSHRLVRCRRRRRRPRISARRSPPPTRRRATRSSSAEGVLDGKVVRRGARPDPAADDEPPRPDRRRDRHGQDEGPSGNRRAALRRRRARLRRRHEGRPLRPLGAGRRERRSPPTGGRSWGRPSSRRRSRSSTSRSAASAPASRCARPCPTSARSCSARCCRRTRPRSRASRSLFRYADQKGLPLLDLSDLRALLTFLGSEDGKAELTGIGGVASSTIGVLLRQLVQLEDGGGTEFFGEPQLEIADLLRHDRGRPRDHLVPRAAGSAGQADALLDRADVAARRALRGAAGDRRPRQAEARLLLRRGASAVRRSDEGLPRLDRPDRPADPLQGRRRLLLHPAAEGRAGGRARPARQPDAVRAARVHPGRREGAEGDRRERSPGPTSTTWRSCSRSWGSARRR